MGQTSVRAAIDTIRSLASTGISGTYAKVGSVILFPYRLICFTNNTDGDMFFSDDGVNNKLFVASNSFKLFDIASNESYNANSWTLPAQVQWYVKQSTAPSKNAVYIEIVYAN